MSKIAYIFPGQASQYVGMGRDFYQASPKVKELYDNASEILGYDLPDVSFNGPLEKLTETMHTQPAILVHSLAVLAELGDPEAEVAFTAGHSLGEYSALACAGVLSFEDAITAVRERSRLMQADCDAEDGTMAALIGCEGENLENLIKAASQAGIVQPANFNSPGQVAVSGSRAGVEKAIEIAKEYGAKKAIPLQVGGAFHSPLMASAQKQLGEVLEQMAFNNAQIPVVTNVRAEGSSEPQTLKQLLVDQITSPVLWRQSIQYMIDNGVTKFVEIGPGKVLSGLVKRISREVTIENIDTRADLEKYKEGVQA